MCMGAGVTCFGTSFPRLTGGLFQNAWALPCFDTWEAGVGLHLTASTCMLSALTLHDVHAAAFHTVYNTLQDAHQFICHLHP